MADFVQFCSIEVFFKGNFIRCFVFLHTEYIMVAVHADVCPDPSKAFQGYLGQEARFAEVRRTAQNQGKITSINFPFIRTILLSPL
jgi:hypothetical protein